MLAPARNVDENAGRRPGKGLPGDLVRATAGGLARAAASAGIKGVARHLPAARAVADLLAKRFPLLRGPAGPLVGCFADVALELVIAAPALRRGEIDRRALAQRIAIVLAASLTGVAAGACAAAALASAPVLLEAAAVATASASAACLVQWALTYATTSRAARPSR